MSQHNDITSLYHDLIWSHPLIFLHIDMANPTKPPVYRVLRL